MATRVPIVRSGSAHVPLGAGDSTAIVRSYREVTASATVATTDDVVVSIATVALTLTLPTAATAGVGKVFTVVNQGTVAVTLAGGPVRTANATTVTSVAAGSSLTFISSGSQYRRLL
jgi:hypothetical protein